MEEKNCKNCKYYKPHYVKKKTCLYEVPGHCNNKRLNKLHPKRIGKLYENCECWEPIENQKEERRKSIKETLRDMEKSLRDIKLILKDDEE